MAAQKYTKPHVFDNGILAYPKRGWEPPPLIEGYKRKSDNPRNSDAWVLLPVWQDCPFRLRVQVRKDGCRCITFYHTCNNQNIIALHGDRVVANLNLCSSCKFCPHNNARQ